MGKFYVDFDGPSGGNFSAWDFEELTGGELLGVLRPAAVFLAEAYQTALRKLGLVDTGALVESIEFDDDYGNDWAIWSVKPMGKRSKGMRTRKSRAGSSTAKYAKHNRVRRPSRLRNDELGYYLEYGTPRIPATHWMENTNEETADQIHQLIDDNFTELLKKKGLL